MARHGLQTPVAFLIFNRPETTRRVFERIRQAQPTQLFVIADGPRPDRPTDADRCAQTRAVIDSIDWDCQIVRNFSDSNLGCKNRVSSGITWLFEQVEEAIILEDDCLPDPTFFQFCAELLERYRQDQRIMLISGDNFQAGRRRNRDSYYFSKCVHIWGWATWRRAWQHYDVEIRKWPKVRDEGWLLDWLGDTDQTDFWKDIFQMMYEQRHDTWDFQWAFSVWMQGALCILPAVNLVENIGFGADATHTISSDNPLCNPVQPMKFPLQHPELIIADAQADALTFDRQHHRASVAARAAKKLLGIFHR